MRRLWLLFAQTVTICLGVLFVVATLRPEWLRGAPRTAPRAPLSAPAVEPAPRAAPISYAGAVALAAPAVVNVYTSKRVREPIVPLPDDPDLARLFRNLPGFTRSQKTTALGSGVIVSKSGYILTNDHVIESADTIRVSLNDGRQAEARVVGADRESDLAVLKIDLPDLAVITFNSRHQVRVGDVVLAIGNPFGVGQTTTMGIVSALGRNRLGLDIDENFIQTDAAINPGNSGGALIDTSGQLVGINTAIYSGSSGGSLGIGFAIPAPAAHQIMEQIIKTGHVTRGWLGIEPQDITPDLAHAFHLSRDDGIIVASVQRRSPAWDAGVHVGDIVRKIDGHLVYDTVGFLSQIAPIAPGREVTLTILRDGRTHEVRVKVGARPPGPTR
ncbi:MAG: PDZ domain-containing protein [Candidimonas sp.]|nr:MAG: PDZ domain-containing protein [Candidimonas sp.]